MSSRFSQTAGPGSTIGPSQPVSPLEKLLRLGVDSAVAIALVAILSVVYVVDLATSAAGGNVDPSDGGTTELVVQQVEHVETTETPQVKPLRLAITPSEFDDMGKLLGMLGEGYKYATIELDQLRNPDVLGQYDVIFLTCGTDSEAWLGEAVGTGERNTRTFMMKPEIVDQLHDSIRGFVQRGGTLYASDWRFNLVNLAFPEFVDRSAFVRGAAQEVDAEVVDDGLRELIGERIQLRFDLDSWFPAAISSSELKTYIRGQFQTVDGSQASAPLLVKVPFGEGTILFTSFHNEKQNSEEELALLKYLVFTTVTARVESKITETMVRGGFSPQKQNLLSTSSAEPSVTKTYQCTKAGHLQFVLAFENQGARLYLEIIGPDGRKFDKEGASTIKIDVTDAGVGAWKYTVTAKKVPYENFPFTLTVWQK